MRFCFVQMRISECKLNLWLVFVGVDVFGFVVGWLLGLVLFCVCL